VDFPSDPSKSLYFHPDYQDSLSSHEEKQKRSSWTDRRKNPVNLQKENFGGGCPVLWGAVWDPKCPHLNYPLK